jgi:hypothetical protein
VTGFGEFSPLFLFGQVLFKVTEVAKQFGLLFSTETLRINFNKKWPWLHLGRIV